MAKSYSKSKGRNGKGRFAGIPHKVMDHPDYIGLSCGARALLFEAAKLFNGHNNGALAFPWSQMRSRGWRSQTTLAKNLKELQVANWLRKTRDGRFLNPGGQVAFYSLTWLPIDECKGKDLDMGPTFRPYRSLK